MKINNLFLTAAFFILSISAWAQSGSLDIVKMNYPQIYTSIVQDADKQWGSDQKNKLAVMEGQAKAFLDIIGSQESINGDIMTEAILSNSLPGTRDSNIRIINDLSIDNPFPLLKCDWYKVKSYYQKKAGSLQNYASTTVRSNTTPTTTVRDQNTQQSQQSPVVTETTPTTTVRQREQQPTYPTRERETQTYTPPARTPSRSNQGSTRTYSSDYGTDNDSEYPRYYTRRKVKKESPFHLGVRVGFPTGAMYNMGDYSNREDVNSEIDGSLRVKSKVNISLEGGVAFSYKKNGFFVQNETSLQFLNAKFENEIYKQNQTDKKVTSHTGEKYTNKYLNLTTAFHIGGYYDMGDNWHLIAGVGPYVSFLLNSDYDKYGIFEKNVAEDYYEKYMKDGEKSVNFGVSGVFGADFGNFRAAIYPNLGLSKVHETETYKPFYVTLGFTYWFF